MKGKTTISIDVDLLNKAKEKNVNVSEATENTLKRIMSGNVETKEEELKCFYCGIKLPRQTAEQAKLTKEEIIEKNISNEALGLVWLANYNVWCCDSCLRTEINKIPIVIGTRRG